MDATWWAWLEDCPEQSLLARALTHGLPGMEKKELVKGGRELLKDRVGLTPFGWVFPQNISETVGRGWGQ